MEKVREEVFQLSSPPRLLLLQQKQLDIINEEIFKYSLPANENFAKLNKNIIGKLKSKIFTMESLKNIKKYKGEDNPENQESFNQDSGHSMSDEKDNPVSTEKILQAQNKPKNKRKNKGTKKIKKLLNQEMIDRAKKGHDEYCDTNLLQVTEIMPRKTWNLKKESFRYVKLAYDDNKIKNNLRL